jgi:hypothetical protein
MQDEVMKARTIVRNQDALSHHLAAQIIQRQQHGISFPKKLPLANLFARDESPLAIQQRHQEEECLMHQLEAADAKKYINEVEKTQEKVTDLRQLKISQIMHKDEVEAEKKLRVEMRKYLETYWKEQSEIHKSTQFSY